jgi:hypothetical protein
MSYGNRQVTAAQVISLADARDRLPGERGVERLSDGRRKGDHGNRASKAMKDNVIAGLRHTLEVFGDVTVEDKQQMADAAGVTLRTIHRWWEAELAAQVDGHRAPHTHAAGSCVPSCVDGRLHGRGCRKGLNVNKLPGWLYRHIEQGQAVQLTPDEVAFFASHSTVGEAIAAVRASDDHRLRHYGISTLYAAWAKVAEPVRVGAKHGAKKQRAIEATYPLSGTDMLNETWSIDEYDLKVTAYHRGHKVRPKLLVVRERLSGLPLAKLVLDRPATGADTGVVLAAAAIGYTVAHPYDDNRNLRVGGVARYLNADQGGSFLGKDGAAAARRLGIGLAAIPSHQPQANGDHEVMHQSLLRHFGDGPGSRRGWVDRAGKRLVHGLVPFDAVVDEVDAWFAEYIHTVHNAYAADSRAGMSRLEAYARAIDDGQAYEGHQLTAEDEAALATFAGERTYDPTRGIAWDNRYFLSRDLATKARKGQKLTVRTLLNPDVLYVFDAHDKFLAIAEPRDDGDAADRHGLYQDRARREAFVENAAQHRAGDARAGAEKALDAQGEKENQERAARRAAEKNKSKNKKSSKKKSSTTSTSTSSSGTAGADGGRDAFRLVKSTQVGRTPPTPAVIDDQQAVEAVANRLKAARNAKKQQTQHPDQQPSGNTPVNQTPTTEDGNNNGAS